MKNTSLIAALALILSCTSIFVSLNKGTTAPSQTEIDEMVSAALEKREKEYVASTAPDVTAIYLDLLNTKDPFDGNKPETIAELAAPLGKIISQLTGK